MSWCGTGGSSAPPRCCPQEATPLNTPAPAPPRPPPLAPGARGAPTPWAPPCRPAGVVVGFRDLAAAAPTALKLVGFLPRRCDPAVLTLVVEGGSAADPQLGSSLAAHVRAAAGR